MELQNVKNPIVPGHYADPEARFYEEKYWIYVTQSKPFEEQQNLTAFSSEDMKTWEMHENIIDMSGFPWVWGAVWAPTVVEKNGKYYHYNRENAGSGYSSWSKRELTQADFNSWIREYLDYTYALDFSKFTFDATTGTYKATSYVVNQYLTVSDASLTFVDGRCTKIAYKENGEAHTLEITYAPVTVSVPNV